MRPSACLLAGFVSLILLLACRAEPPPPRAAGDEGEEDAPIVGGACTYDRVSFLAVVDSIAPDSRVLAVLPDSVPRNIGMCLREEAGGRWWVPAPEGPVARGDTLEVSGDIIATGTCSPCALSTRRIGPR